MRILLTAAAMLVGIAGASGLTRQQKATGSIEGRVTFAGPPPAPTLVVESGSTQHVLHVDAAGGLQYAVVYLPDGRPGAPIPRAALTIDQRRFIFEPQVLAVRAGQTVRFTNADPAAHNVRSQDPANGFNIQASGTDSAGQGHRFAATPAGRPVELSCDLHSTMAAWVYVFEHDHFAVTGAGGAFVIGPVPAGRHRVAVRQPAGRLARDLAVDVRAGESTRLDVRFTPADLGLPAR
jgi:plastocyanin